MEGPLTLIMPDEEMQEENTGFWQRGTTMFCDSKLIEESQREMRELASVEARIQELKNIPQKAEEKKAFLKDCLAVISEQSLLIDRDWPV